jgi:hypothetical protein
MRRFIWVVVLLCACLAVPQAARSAPILDQEYFPARVSEPGMLEYAMLAPIYQGMPGFAQTFTVGREGLMTGVEILLETYDGDSYAGSRTLAIFATTAAGYPDLTGAPLGLASVTVAPGWMGVYFGGAIDTPFHVTPGTVLAIADLGLAGADAYWVGNYDDDGLNGGTPHTHYAGGTAFYLGSGGWSIGEGDFGFRTYVDPGSGPGPQPVPEPASLLLVAIGLAGWAARARRTAA